MPFSDRFKVPCIGIQSPADGCSKLGEVRRRVDFIGNRSTIEVKKMTRCREREAPLKDGFTQTFFVGFVPMEEVFARVVRAKEGA